MNEEIAVRSDNGIIIEMNDKKIMIDPKYSSETDITFVSHAHIDHVHRPKKGNKILTSNETAYLARKRGYDLGDTTENIDGFKLINSGHIIGSCGLSINDDEIFYTGDFSTRSRAFLKKCPTLKCKTLIIESTFGKESFRFPAIEKILHEVNSLISDLFSQGIPVILMGYPLGKAQILSHFFSIWDPIYVYESVQKMNDACFNMGIDLQKFISFKEALEKNKLNRKPWILISPLFSGRNGLIKSLKKKYNAVTIGFSGWSTSRNYRYAMSLDYSFPLSDHCDFEELIDYVNSCQPETIYTVHGFSTDFAEKLRTLGYDAIPL